MKKKDSKLRYVLFFIYTVFGLYLLNLYLKFIDLSKYIPTITEFSNSGFKDLIAGVLIIIAGLNFLRRKSQNYFVGPSYN